MPNPTFSKSGVTTLTFSQGNLAPSVIDEAPRQIINEAENGSQSVYTLSGTILTHTLQFQDLPSTDHDNLRTFLRNSAINYSSSTFTYTDSDGATHTVRYVDSTLRRTRNATGTYDLSITLRELL